MKRCRQCGHTEFSAHQKIYTDIIVNGDNQFLKNNSKDNSISVYKQGEPYGPYSCKLCGTVYQSLEDLVEDSSEYAGYIFYIDSDECIGYKTDEELIRQFEDSVYCRGPRAQRVEGINEKNLSLRYRINQIIADEYGYDETPFHEWLETHKKRG